MLEKLSNVITNYFALTMLTVCKLRTNDRMQVRHHLEAQTDEVMPNRYVPLLKR